MVDGGGIEIRTIDLTTRFTRHKHLNAQSGNMRRVHVTGDASRWMAGPVVIDARPR